jgi:hypothetical protein
LSIDLEENLFFHVAENVYVNIDVGGLNDVLRTIEHTQINEDDDIDEHQFNEENYD